LLKPSYWFGTGPGRHHEVPVTPMLVTNEGMLANAWWVHRKATQLEMFNGRASDQPTAEQVTALMDVFDSFGWNIDLRSVSHSLDRKAWWNTGDRGADPNSTLLRVLVDTCKTKAAISDMFDTVRGNIDGGVPCKRHPDDAGHYYNKDGLGHFKCPRCNHKVTGGAILEWFSKLVDAGVLDKEVFGLEQDVGDRR